MLTEEFVRHQVRHLLRQFGLPQAKDIGQHEVVSRGKLELLDAVAHDEEAMVRALVGKWGPEVNLGFQSLQPSLRTPGIREFRSRLLKD